MKLAKSFLAAALCFSLSSFSFIVISTQTVSAQDSKIALQRGFRTGYSDGYMAGYRDSIDNSAKSYARHPEYAKADRAFSQDYGSLTDYRDGYQQGFESGYNTGFEKRSFDSALPSDLKKRGAIAANTIPATTTPEIITPEPVDTATAKTETPGVDESKPEVNNFGQAPTIKYRAEDFKYTGDGNSIILIPTNTELIVELQDDLSTERNRQGDRFTARVVSPAEIAGAIVEGRVTKVTKPGRIKRRSEMSLSFDRILLNESRWSNFNAMLTEVMPVKGDNVRRVDTEGTAVGKSSLKDDGIKVGGATGAGLVTGAIIGGPVGAGVGAAVGAAFGVGAVVIERGKHIRLAKAQQLRVKTAYETQIR